MTPLQVRYFPCCDGWWLWWRDTLKVQTAISRHHVMCDFRDSSQSLLFFLIICLQTFLPILPDVILVPFPWFLRVFSIFTCWNTELLLNFLCQTCYSLRQTTIFEKILDVRLSNPASLFSFNVPLHYCLSLRGPTIFVVVSSSSWKATPFLLLPPCLILVLRRIHQGTVYLRSASQSNCSLCDRWSPMPLHSIRLSCLFVTVHACIDIPRLPDNSSLFHSVNVPIPGCTWGHFAQTLLHRLVIIHQLFVLLIWWRPLSLVL